MPVFVTAADHGIGPALVTALRVDGADVRAFATGTGDVAAVRATGAFVAVGDLDDEGHLDAAMTDAHTVVVPTETWAASPPDLVEATTTIVRAAELARVTRLVLVSLCGADPTSESALLAAYGHVEDVATAADLQTLVVRTDGVVEHGFPDLLAGATGAGDEVVAPVGTDRLVGGVVALDAARSARAGGHALFTALGEPASLATWRRRLAGPSGDADSSSDDGTGADGLAGDLVGRRWLAPDRRSELQAILTDRGGPPVAGANLWDFDPAGGA